MTAWHVLLFPLYPVFLVFAYKTVCTAPDEVLQCTWYTDIFPHILFGSHMPFTHLNNTSSSWSCCESIVCTVFYYLLLQSFTLYYFQVLIIPSLQQKVLIEHKWMSSASHSIEFSPTSVSLSNGHPVLSLWHPHLSPYWRWFSVLLSCFIRSLTGFCAKL